MVQMKTDADKELLDEICELAESSSWFDSTFVDRVQTQLKDRGFISDKQRQALIRIRERLNDRRDDDSD